MNKRWKSGLAVTAGLLLAFSGNTGLPGIAGNWGQVAAYAEEAEEFELDENGVLIGYHGDGGDVVIPDGVMKIGNNAFGECESLTSVIIPEGVTEIGYGAFAMCTKLKNVEIPSSVEVIRTYAFYGCEGLTNIIIPEGVIEIEDYVFDGCNNLVSIKIPDSLMRVGVHSLEGCDNLSNLEGKKFILDENGGVVEYLPRFLSSPIGNVVIPDGVTAIWSGFRDSSGDGTDLTSLKASGSVKEIGGWTFAFCDDLTEVELPGVITIGECAFKNCSNLKSVKLSNEVISIGEGAFSWCNSLTDIYYAGTEEDWKKIEISSIDDGNAALWNATIHYNSTMPDESVTENPSAEKPTDPAGDSSIDEEAAPGTGDTLPVAAGSMMVAFAIMTVLLLTNAKKVKEQDL